MNELWVKCYCSDQYEVSNTGLVRSVNTMLTVPRRGGSYKKRLFGRVLCQKMDSGGHLKVNLSRTVGTHIVARLVYISFNNHLHGKIVHLDGDVRNNMLSNLVDSKLLKEMVKPQRKPRAKKPIAAVKRGRASKKSGKVYATPAQAKAHRLSLGLTQVEMSSRYGKSRPWWHTVEIGLGRVPKDDLR